MIAALSYPDDRKMLSQREAEIVHLLAYEYNTREIAEKLFISSETVKSHRRNIQIKFGARNVAGVVRVAFQSGILRGL